MDLHGLYGLECVFVFIGVCVWGGGVVGLWDCGCLLTQTQGNCRLVLQRAEIGGFQGRDPAFMFPPEATSPPALDKDALRGGRAPLSFTFATESTGKQL